MSKKQQKAAAVLAVALVVEVVAQKTVAKQARVLGVPALAVIAASWFISQAIA